MNGPSRLAVLGAGHVGPVIARLAIKAGYPVAIATSGDPEDIALIAELVIPGAQPRWASEAVADRIRRDVDSGLASGQVRGTPTLFIDGIVHRAGYEPPTLLAALAG